MDIFAPGKIFNSLSNSLVNLVGKIPFQKLTKRVEGGLKLDN